MGTRRTPLVLCIIGSLWLGACGSDDDSSSESTAATSDVVAITTTTAAAASTATTATVVPGVTVATVATATTVATAATSVTSTTTAPRVVTSPSDNVKLGDSGEGVKQIQTALKAQGYQVTVDGDFGNQTATAVKAFQKKNGLKQDGIVGPKTWAKLSAGGSGSTSSSATTTTGA